MPRFGYELMNVFEPGADFVRLFPDIHRNNTTLSPLHGKRSLTNVLYPDRRRPTGDAALNDRRLFRSLIEQLSYRTAEPDFSTVTIALRPTIDGFAEHYGVPVRRVIAHVEAFCHHPTSTVH